MSTKAIPLSGGMAAKKCLKASSPPAEAPIPTTARQAREVSEGVLTSWATGGMAPGRDSA